jgi:hypothetical protein
MDSTIDPTVTTPTSSMPDNAAALRDRRTPGDAGDSVAGEASDAASAAPTPSATVTRTSDILRGILRNNPGVKTFTVERILSSIGNERFEASLMMFSLPTIVPVPRPWGFGALPTGGIALQLMGGQKQIKLPGFILKKAVSRRALAVAIHGALPILEAAEKVLRPRWSWVRDVNVRRAIGLFVFLLAIAIANPLFGFTSLHATSIFVMSLGMAEQDGLAVLVGVAVGCLSLAIFAASGVSARGVRAKAVRWLRRIARRLGQTAFGAFLKRRGYDKLGRLMTLSRGDWLLLWNPEKRGASRSAQAPTPQPGSKRPNARPVTPAVRPQPVRTPRAA